MELVERFKKLYAGVVYDAMKFDLGVRPWISEGVHRVTPPDVPLFGPTLLCRGERVERKEDINDDVRFDMLQHIPPGGVLVIVNGDARPSVAHFGDISARLAKKAGAVGAVIDGYTRDIEALWDFDFPVFCKGAKPQDAYGEWQIVEFQNTGSHIFADGDGVITIPAGLAQQICDLAEERAKREDEMRTALLTEDPKTVRERFGRW